MSTLMLAFAILGLLTLLVGLLGYAWFLKRAFFGDENNKERRALNANLAANLGIPCSALAAFGVVAVLHWPAALNANTKGHPLSFEMFSLSFSGPAGPVLLWLAAFLGMIFALWLLRLP